MKGLRENFLFFEPHVIPVRYSFHYLKRSFSVFKFADKLEIDGLHSSEIDGCCHAHLIHDTTFVCYHRPRSHN